MQPPVIIIAGLLVALHLPDAAASNAFSCQARASGYYADVPSGCQIYHMCDTLGRQFSYACPNTTLFQQRMLICDHWYMVNCSRSELDYDANLLIGQRGKPFVADDDAHPYYRTPRPDLLAHHSSSEYNIIYRAGRAHDARHLPGRDAEIAGQAYFLPTQARIAPRPSKTKKPIVASSQVPQVAFASSFAATTPVYPKIAPMEAPLAIVDDDIHRDQLTGLLLPPRESRVNFPSNFQATTPVYPKFVAPQSPLAEEEPSSDPGLSHGLRTILQPPKGGKINRAGDEVVVVNFPSTYKATTPVYPASAPSEEALAVEEAQVDPNQPSLSTVIQPPRAFVQNGRNTVLQPSVVAQPPQVDINWTELRRILLIPDFQFPLDASAARPSYDAGTSSFHEQPLAYEVHQRKHA